METRNLRKERMGVVFSNKMDKTITIAVTRYMQRQGQIWIRVFPDKPITKKPAEVRMGKGKGAPEGFVAPITPGRMLFEVEGVSFEIAKEALRLAAQKLPVTTKFVVRRDYDITSQTL